MSNNNSIASPNVLNYLPLNEPSLYIKWSPKSITSKDVYNILTELNLGLIDRVQSRPTLNNKNQQEGIAFTIYMTEWYRNSNSDQIRLKLINNDDNFITITYEPNKYWKVYSYKSNNNGRRNNLKKEQHNFKPSIRFNDDNINMNNSKTNENGQMRQRNHQYDNTSERTKKQTRQKSSQLHNQQNNQRLKFLNPAETLKSISVTFDETSETKTSETKTSETKTNEIKKRNWLSDSDTDEDEN